MNIWIFTMTWMLAKFFLWLATFAPSERVALGSAFLVLIGVIGEYVVEIPAVEKRERLKNGIKRFSMAILVLGLSGDVLGVVMGQAEMAALTGEAGDAKISAIVAVGAAKNAADESDKATAFASNATTLANGARREADSFEKDIVSAKEQAANAENDRAVALERTARLEQELSWRTVTPSQAEAIHNFLLRYFFNPHFRGLEIEFVYNGTDPEANEYAEELAKTLRDALRGFGVDVGEPHGEMRIYSGTPPQGLVMEAHEANSAGVILQRALRSAGIDAPASIIENDSFLPEMTIRFLIAAKPRPSGTPK